MTNIRKYIRKYILIFLGVLLLIPSTLNVFAAKGTVGGNESTYVYQVVPLLDNPTLSLYSYSGSSRQYYVSLTSNYFSLILDNNILYFSVSMGQTRSKTSIFLSDTDIPVTSSFLNSSYDPASSVTLHSTLKVRIRDIIDTSDSAYIQTISTTIDSNVISYLVSFSNGTSTTVFVSYVITSSDLSNNESVLNGATYFGYLFTFVSDFTYQAPSSGLVDIDTIYNQVRNEVYDTAYNDGKIAGKIEGRNEALEINKNGSWLSFFDAVFYAPLRALFSVMNFEILGINVFSVVRFFVLTSLVLLVVGWVISKA